MEIYNKKGKVIFEEADLRNANFGNRTFVHIKSTRHELYFLDTLQIGCEIHSIEWWLKNYNEQGIEHDYTEKEVNEYYNYIKMCKEIKDDLIQ